MTVECKNRVQNTADVAPIVETASLGGENIPCSFPREKGFRRMQSGREDFLDIATVVKINALVSASLPLTFNHSAETVHVACTLLLHSSF